jgi:SAM-dependent methyltransferase
MAKVLTSNLSKIEREPSALEVLSMNKEFRRKQQLAFGSVVNIVQARTPKPVYRCVRFGWHQLTSTLDQVGFRRLAWRWRLPTEVGFWDICLATRGMGDPADFARRLAPDQPLQDHLKKLLPPSDGRAYRILDVGAGPLTTVGKVCDGQRIDLHCIDPLSSAYDALLEKNGITPPVRTKYGEAEQVGQMFAEGSFDLVHAANSLDHAHDPVAAIKAAARVVRPGGYVFLEHILNEGDREQYGGLHQWNFGVEGDSFRISSKDGRTTDMAKELAGVASVTHSICVFEDPRKGGTLTVLNVQIRRIQ